MLMTTTHELQGRQLEYIGLVTGEAIIGANVLRDIVASITDVIGGRSGTYEKGLKEGKDIALSEMCQEAKAKGANAVIGIDLDYETVGNTGSMLMVAASGTAVRIIES